MEWVSFLFVTMLGLYCDGCLLLPPIHKQVNLSLLKTQQGMTVMQDQDFWRGERAEWHCDQKCVVLLLFVFKSKK